MVKYDLNLLNHPFGTSNVVRREFVGFIPAVNGGAFSSHLRNRPHPTWLALTGSLVEGRALMWSSPSVDATGRFVRPAYRTPFGVSEPTILGRATAARTARDLCQHSTSCQYSRMQRNSCSVSCRFPLRPARSLRSLSPHGPQASSDGHRDLRPTRVEPGGSTSKYAETARGRPGATHQSRDTGVSLASTCSSSHVAAASSASSSVAVTFRRLWSASRSG